MYEVSSNIEYKINKRLEAILSYLFGDQLTKKIRYNFDGTETVSEIDYRDSIEPDVFIFNKENYENHDVFNSCNIDFNDLEELLNEKVLNVRLIVGKINEKVANKKHNFYNPIYEALTDQYLKYLNSNNEPTFCLIEDPYLFNEDELKSFTLHKNPQLDDMIKKIKIINNRIKYFLILISVDQETNQKPYQKIKAEFISEDEKIFYIPIEKHNKTNRFHDRNILTFDFWINNGHSIESNYNYKHIQTQSFIVPRITNKDRFDVKINGSLLLIKQYCADFDFRSRLPSKPIMSELIEELKNMS